MSEIKGLADKAILVNLSISQYGGTAKDKDATKLVLNNFNALSEAGTFTKHLIPKEGAASRVTTAVNTIRKYFKTHTSPWDYRGTGIIRSSKYQEFVNTIRRLIEEYHEAVKEMISEFPSLQEKAKNTFLQDLYNANDYPSIWELERKFKISLEVFPIPKTEDYRVDWSEEEKRKIDEDRQQLENERLEKVNRGLWERIHNPLKHIALTLSKEDPKIYKSLLTNLSSLLEILPDLNITDDPELEEMRKEILDTLFENDIDAIRESKIIKDETANKAKKLVKKIIDNNHVEEEQDIIDIMSTYAPIPNNTTGVQTKIDN
ncbi:hypothetical protein KKE60_06535 [Patescibacteria group bacterium]|nr:hypothetical protein [Patescibacteria group bacterium]